MQQTLSDMYAIHKEMLSPLQLPVCELNYRVPAGLEGQEILILVIRLFDMRLPSNRIPSVISM